MPVTTLPQSINQTDQIMTSPKISLTCIACFLLIFSSGVAVSMAQSASQPAAQSAPRNHNVRVVSFCFQQGKQSLDAMGKLIDAEGAKGVDLVCLPEEWSGRDPEPMDGPTVTAMAKLAQQYHTYIVCPLQTKRGAFNYNTSVLIDRNGKVAGFYDKAFPYWSEFDGPNPAHPSQGDASVFDTDFGRVGMAICFDAKFPEVFQRLRHQGADLVVWSSAYSGYTELQSYATLYHYYIISSTWAGDCLAYDLTGHNLLDQNDHKGLTIAHINLDMDRQIYHYNFNQAKLKKLLADHGNDVAVDADLPREEWFVLKAKRPDVSARQLGQQYGLETLPDYFFIAAASTSTTFGGLSSPKNTAATPNNSPGAQATI